ncbi:hypothetical protein K2173_023314 [Erythroxylum novogranatense]|uniref:Uncharacterized protein n=1 Tax=Erythroxylum novogranatense TaxID=1862640 RepID=A0AAV8TAZ8_9ROSI|nr:hypothetical protein K2173_023314 [Erythroxylum novogranatense]
MKYSNSADSYVVAERAIQSLNENIKIENTRYLELEKEIEDFRTCCTSSKQILADKTLVETNTRTESLWPLDSTGPSTVNEETYAQGKGLQIPNCALYFMENLERLSAANYVPTKVASFNGKKTPAERSYIISLYRVLVLLHFRSSEQGAIKLMRKLLNAVAESVSADKDLAKELQQMAGRLKLLDIQPDEELSEDHANRILDLASSAAIQQTPVISSRSTRPSRSRRRVRCREETSFDEEISTIKAVSGIQGTTGARSQRASKTAALTKITASRAARINEVDDDTEQDGSELTSEEDSDNSDHLVE